MTETLLPEEYEHPVYSARMLYHLWLVSPDRVSATADTETHSVALHLDDGFLYVLATFEPEDVETIAGQLEEFAPGRPEPTPVPPLGQGPLRLELRLFEADVTPGGDEEGTLSFTLAEAEDMDLAVVCHTTRESYQQVIDELRRAAREVPMHVH